MKTKIIAIVALFILSSCFSTAKTINGDGNIVENNVAVMNFDDIHIGINGCSTVTFQQSDKYSLTVITDQNIMSLIRIKNADGKLAITSAKGINLKPTKLNVIISSPHIEDFIVDGCTDLTFATPIHLHKLGIEVNGSGKVNFTQQVNITDFDIEINGVGSAYVGNASVRKLDIEINGAGSASIDKGMVESLDIEINGSGSVKSDCESEYVDTDISGSGTVYVRAKRLLTYDIAGSGTISYRGDAQIRGDVTRSSRVTKL